jgi:hypothetical protein
MDQIKELPLNELLTVIFTEEPYKFFINESGLLETYFNYKAHLIDIFKLNLKVTMQQMTQQQLEAHICEVLANSIQKGLPLVFNYDKASKFDAKKFFSNFKFISRDFWERKNHLNSDYLRKIGIVNKSNDKDFFGNTGCYRANEDFSISFLCTCPIEELADIKLNLPEGLNVEFYNIK